MVVCERAAFRGALALLVLSLVCCAQAAPPAAGVSLRQEFTLKLGQTVRVKGESLRVKFVSVVEDSRCPKGEQCIRQGSAKISLEVTSGEDKPVALELTTEPSAQEEATGAAHLGYSVTLVALDPYPLANRQTAPEDYRATLVVDKKQAGGQVKAGAVQE
jgi:hypothetical protein